jgi:glycosyltransferase involved in cell wall biosynthesis
MPPLVPLARRIARRADRLLPVSSSLERRLAELRVERPGADVLPMPVDGEVFRPDERDRPPHVPMAPRFVVAARLVVQKRVDLAIEAIGHLREKRAGAILEIAGDGPERGRLEERVIAAGLDSVVRFLGMLPPSDLAARFRRATAVLLTAEEEGYGLTLEEAALCGTPAICVRSGALADRVEDGVTGRLVPAGDSSAIAEAMAGLADDPDLRDRLARAACHRARGATAAPLADRLVALYEEIARP